MYHPLRNTISAPLMIQIYSVPLAAPLPVPLVPIPFDEAPPNVSLIFGPVLGATDALGVPAIDAVVVDCPSCTPPDSNAIRLG